MVLVCPHCREKSRHGEWYCVDHDDLREAFYTFLEPFSATELREQSIRLEDLARAAKGKNTSMRNRRKLLEKQRLAVGERLAIMAASGATEGEQPALRRCRSCGRADCLGTCWGFWKQPASTGGAEHSFGASDASGGIPLAIGDRVVRGRDWRWGQQDGGPGRTGTVKELKSFAAGAGAVLDAVRVEWEAGGKMNLYRNGAEGCFDVQRPGV